LAHDEAKKNYTDPITINMLKCVFSEKKNTLGNSRCILTVRHCVHSAK